MTRIASEDEMTTAELMKCLTDTQAILDVCHQVAWDIQNSDDPKVVVRLASGIQQLTALADDLLEPIYEALSIHGGIVRAPL